MNAPNLRTADTPSSEADRSISSMSGAIAMPRSNGESVFDAHGRVGPSVWPSACRGLVLQLGQVHAELARAIAQADGPDESIFDGSMARWLDGSMARWLDGSMARWLDALEASMTGTSAYDAEALNALRREKPSILYVRDEVF